MPRSILLVLLAGAALAADACNGGSVASSGPAGDSGVRDDGASDSGSSTSGGSSSGSSSGGGSTSSGSTSGSSSGVPSTVYCGSGGGGGSVPCISMGNCSTPPSSGECTGPAGGSCACSVQGAFSCVTSGPCAVDAGAPDAGGSCPAAAPKPGSSCPVAAEGQTCGPYQVGCSVLCTCSKNGWGCFIPVASVQGCPATEPVSGSSCTAYQTTCTYPAEGGFEACFCNDITWSCSASTCQ